MRNSLTLAFILAVAAGLLARPCAGGDPQPVRVGFYLVDGYCATNEVDGAAVGFNVDLIDLLAEHNGWTVTREYGDFPDLLARLERGELDVVPGVSMTPERTKRFVYPHLPADSLRPCLFVQPNSFWRAEDPRTWSSRIRVGMLDWANARHFADVDRITERMLREALIARNLHQPSIQHYEREKDLFSAFAMGDCQAILALATSAYLDCRLLLRVGAIPLYVVCSRQNAALGAQIDATLTGIVSGDPAFFTDLHERHFPMEIPPVETPESLAPPAPEVRVQKGFVTVEQFALTVAALLAVTLLVIVSHRAVTLRRVESARVRRNSALTEANAAYTETQRIMQMGDCLRKALEILLRERRAETAFPEICGLIEEMLGYGRVWIRRDGETSAGRQLNLSPAAEAILGRLAKCGRVLTATASTAGRLTDDAVRAPFQEFFTLTGFQSAFVLPITLEGRSWGWMAGYAARDAHMDEAVRRYLDMFLHALDSAIARSEANTELSLTVDRLHESLARQEKLQKELESALATAEEASRAKTKFLATMSHEIRTPLNAIVGFSEYLAKPDVEPALAREYAAAVERGSKVLMQLLDDILELSQLEFCERNFRQGRCDFARLLREMATLFTARAESGGIDLRVSVDASVPVLKLDEQPMRQILLNLTGNALKFTTAGFVQLAVAVTRRDDGLADARIIVRDTGCGISSERLSSVMDFFNQDIIAHGDVYKGTGLGLPLVKRLAEAVGGRVSIASVVGEGTVVTVDLDGLEIVARDGRETAADEVVLSRPERLCVLTADDVAMNLKILDVHLTRLGVRRIIATADGAAALALIRRHRPDVAFIDLWMPKMNGAALARAVREDPSLASVRLVALTADVDVGNTFDIRAFDRVLTKPVTGEKIRQTLAELAPPEKEETNG